MKHFLIATVFTLLSTACAVETPDDAEPTLDDPAGEAERLGTSRLDDDLPLVPFTQSSVPAGCYAPVTCSGTKTCGAWTSYSNCGAPFQACTDTCSFPTRWGCLYPATVQGQNRFRTCTMRATGATCTEIDYRQVQISCPV